MGNIVIVKTIVLVAIGKLLVAIGKLLVAIGKLGFMVVLLCIIVKCQLATSEHK